MDEIPKLDVRLSINKDILGEVDFSKKVVNNENSSSNQKENSPYSKWMKLGKMRTPLKLDDEVKLSAFEVKIVTEENFKYTPLGEPNSKHHSSKEKFSSNLCSVPSQDYSNLDIFNKNFQIISEKHPDESKQETKKENECDLKILYEKMLTITVFRNIVI